MFGRPNPHILAAVAAAGSPDTGGAQTNGHAQPELPRAVPLFPDGTSWQVEYLPEGDWFVFQVKRPLMLAPDEPVFVPAKYVKMAALVLLQSQVSAEFQNLAVAPVAPGGGPQLVKTPS